MSHLQMSSGTDVVSVPVDAIETLREIVVLAMAYAGDVAEGEQVAAPMRKFGDPIADLVGPMPFVNWQQVFDSLLMPGALEVAQLWQGTRRVRGEPRALDPDQDQIQSNKPAAREPKHPPSRSGVSSSLNARREDRRE